MFPLAGGHRANPDHGQAPRPPKTRGATPHAVCRYCRGDEGGTVSDGPAPAVRVCRNTVPVLRCDVPPLVDLAHRLRRKLIALSGRPTQGVKAMIYDGQGRLLLVRHAYGRSDLWMLPGGGIARRESPEAAVRREVREEVGCALIAIEPLGTYAARAEGRRDTVHLFRATTADTPTVDGVELVEARFFGLDALPSTVSPATMRRVDEVGGILRVDGRW
jgi:8-oxo-dGTP pyrophosphatase MutT (NUDIX family)